MSYWFDYLGVSKKEMREIVKDTGWKVENISPQKEVHI